MARKKSGPKKSPARKSKARKKAVDTVPSMEHLHPSNDGPDFPDGSAEEGFIKQAPSAAEAEEQWEGNLGVPTTEDGFLDTAQLLPTADPETVIVQDFDPTDPGAPLAEPQKVLKPHDRIARKRARGSRE